MNNPKRRYKLITVTFSLMEYNYDITQNDSVNDAATQDFL